MKIQEAIQQRHSTRTFTGEPLTDREAAVLKDAISNVRTPFCRSDDYTIRLVCMGDAADFKPETYGFISKAPAFLLLGVRPEAKARLGAAFALEKIVLFATSIGLGTCWIGGTFKAESFGVEGVMPEGQELEIVCPVGKPREPRFLERIGKAIMGSAHRKPFGKLFFNESFEEPLQADCSAISGALEMVRLAPSARNIQPWRVLVRDNGKSLEFYYLENGKFSMVDMGIALCHFSLALDEGVDYFFGRCDSADGLPKNLKYLLTAVPLNQP